jgi:hypothetical protein
MFYVKGGLIKRSPFLQTLKNVVLYSMKNEIKNNRHSKEQRHMMQLIRRNMLQKAKPSGKVYNRKKLK